jgi:hypothetical protein
MLALLIYYFKLKVMQFYCLFLLTVDEDSKVMMVILI